MDCPGEIYMGSVLLEKNRWAGKKSPTFRVSDWVDRFTEDGFDGVELWANHAVETGEVERLKDSTCPISVFSSYAAFTDAAEAEREGAKVLAGCLNSPFIKYNIGAESARWETYLKNLRTWRAQLPDTVTLLCECHPGTVIEDVAAARKFFDELGMKGHGIIVHPFSRLDTLIEWFEAFGSSIQHAHLQMRDGNNQCTRFDRYLPRVQDALSIMNDYGYQGSFTLEFTEGTGQANENIEDLYKNALRDFSCLKERLES
jgi:sugar phosphate isomerase/epimerase